MKWLRRGGYLVASVLSLIITVGPSALAAGTINEYPLGLPGASPFGITAGPDGNLWIAERAGDIAKMSTSGTVLATYAVPGGGEPFEITTGSDGNLWFTDSINDAIGKITTSGTITEYTSGITASSSPSGITLGGDGNIWFTEDTSFPAKVGKITTSGVVTEYSLSGSGGSEGIATGADGNVWVPDGGGIDRITPSGTITTFSVGSNDPTYAVAGPDGNIWFNSWNHSIVGKITTSGVVTTYATPHDTDVYGMGSGPDGNVWYSVPFLDSIARVTPSGAVTEFATPTTGSGPAGLTAGPDGNLWFSEQGTDLIGEYMLVDPPVVRSGSNTKTAAAKTATPQAPNTGFGAPVVMVSPALAAIGGSSALTTAFGVWLLYGMHKRQRSLIGSNR